MAVPNFEDFDSDFATPAQWAAMYRSYGLQVIPGHMPAEGKSWKRPYLAEWTSLQQALVPDATFRRWYDPATGEHRNRRNMGIITGACSDGAFIIDLDTHKNRAAGHWWQGVCDVHNNSMQPETPRQRTGGGGQQLLFRAPAGWTPPTNKTGIGVDFRGQAGFAVLPSSLHDSGKAYEWLPGKAPWEVPIAEAPAWLCDEIDKLVGLPGNINSGELKLPPQSTDSVTVNTATGGDFDAFGNRIDGREEAMRDMVWRCVVKRRRMSPIRPTGVPEQRLILDEFDVYERTVQVQNPLPGENKSVGLEREGRGFSAFAAKWQYAMRQWDAEVAQAAAQPDPSPDLDPAAEFNEAATKGEAAAKADPAGLFELLDVAQIKTMPDPKWLVGGLIVERALGFIYGPPGCLKTFIALDMALSFACSRPMWWDRAVEQPGAVIYISSEGQADLKFRIMAWEQNRGVNADTAPFRLIRQSINFMDGKDIGKLLATVQAVVDQTGLPIAAVFVDTVSRVLPGAEENLQKDMTIFVDACDKVRQRFGCTVIGIHHTSRAGNMRGSTVIPGAGDFIIEVKREPGAETGSITAVKIKAGEDGWEQPFKVTKLAVGTLAGNTSLALDPIEVVPRETGNGWPERDVCRQILAAIEEQWVKGEPWCYAHNTSRAATINIMKRWHLERTIVKDMLETWTANKIISEEIFNIKNQSKGYKKLLDI